MSLDKNKTSSFSKLIKYFNEKDYDKAENFAKSLIEKWPQQTLSWKILGSIYRQRERLEDSLDAFEKAINIASNDAEAHFGFANALQDLKRFEDAKQYYQHAVSINPNYPEALNNLGITFKELKMLEDSEACHRRAISQRSSDSAFHNNLGVTLKLMGRNKEAIKSYQEAIKNKADYVDAYSNLASVYETMGMFADSEACRRSALAVNILDPTLHNALGISLNFNTKREEAIKTFQKAIKIKPDFKDAIKNLADTYYALGMLEESISKYKDALVLSPSDPTIYNNLALALSGHGKNKEAIINYKKAIDISPDYPEAHMNLGRLFFLLKKYKEASEHFMLSSIDKAKSYNLRCLFYTNKELFLEEYDKLVIKNERNAIIGYLGCVSELKYKTNRTNLFCNDPLKYIYVKNLQEHYNFKENFIDPLNSILDEGKILNRNQDLLINGTQTAGNIFESTNDAIKNIKEIILLEIEKYRLNFKKSNEGFIQHWPKKPSIYGWLIKMKSGGELSPHMHDTGWVTGSIYINLPKKIEPESGNIVMSLNDSHFPLPNQDVKEINIRVNTGTLCLFPASIMHHTTPFSSNEDRIVLAFDVISR